MLARNRSARRSRARTDSPHITTATAIGLHEGRLRDVIQALKYDARPTIARHLARRMAQAGAALLAGADAVVPVPLHRSRERARGFNQARELARHLGAPVRDVLVRVRRTETQADLPAGRRHANVRGAFALRPGATLAGATIVLIDDVNTTGATLNACAAALRDGGATDSSIDGCPCAAARVTASVDRAEARRAALSRRLDLGGCRIPLLQPRDS